MRSRVIILPCTEYDEGRICRLLREGLELAGPLPSLIRKEERILLKPNLLKAAAVDQAVITHPAVIASLVRILRAEGYEDIVLADSCGHGTTSSVIRGTGMDQALEQFGIPAIDYSEGVKVSFPEGSIAREFILPKELLEADCVISVSKMKTHALERITGAVKNSYGFIYGANKAMGHTRYPDADSFARMLIDLNRCVSPRLYIMDGIVAMEGNGPGSGDPVPMNVMLISKDPVALDTVFARLICLDPLSVPTIYHGEQMGFGASREEDIELLMPDGQEVSFEELVRQYGNPDFNVDRSVTRDTVWTRMAALIQPLRRRPVIDADKCVRCGICVESCPVEGKAVDFRSGREKPPVYDYKRCIRCFCCQEMCPQKAIRVR